MAGELSLRLEASGGYNGSDVLTEEIWAVTLRLALVFGTVTPIATFPTNWTVEEYLQDVTDTGWTISSNWKILGPGGVNTFDPVSYLNDQAGPAMASWVNAGAISNRAKLNTLKLYPIVGPTGKAVPAPPFTQGTPATLTYTTIPVGGNTGAMCPPQDSAVMSHATGQTGKRGRGRMYLPALAVGALNSNGTLSDATQNNLRSNQVTMLEALQYSDVAALGAHVLPVVSGKPYAAYGVILNVRSNDIVDTQQRRRDRLKAIYATTPVVYT